VKVDAEDSPFAFRKEYGGIHPYQKGDRVAADFIDHVKHATVKAAYWYMGYAKVDLKFDDDPKPGVYRWGAKRVTPLNVVDQLGEIA
jgi:hypothetical protein